MQQELTKLKRSYELSQKQDLLSQSNRNTGINPAINLKNIKHKIINLGSKEQPYRSSSKGQSSVNDSMVSDLEVRNEQNYPNNVFKRNYNALHSAREQNNDHDMIQFEKLRILTTENDNLKVNITKLTKELEDKEIDLRYLST
jgi:hypothetical protein